MSTRNVFLGCSLATFLFAGATLTMSDLATAGGKSNTGEVTNGSQETRKLEKPVNEADFRTNKPDTTTKATAKKGKVNMNDITVTKEFDKSSSKFMAPASKSTTSGNAKSILYDPPFKK